MCRHQQRKEEAISSPRLGVKGSCEPLTVGPGTEFVVCGGMGS